MPFCDICSGHYFEHRMHKCDPIFECCEVGEDDWRQIRATDYGYAAEKIAEDWDSHSGDGPQHREILVRKQGEDVAKKFQVTYEYRVDYDSEEIE